MSNAFGPTGKHPEGKIHQSDEGEIIIGIAPDFAHGTVVINFGIPILWIGLPVDNARAFAKLILEKADLVSAKPT